MKTNNKSRPIAALCTPPGIASLAVIRISGFELNTIINKITGGKILKNRMATLSGFYDPSTSSTLDSCIFTLYRAPNSFTGENVLEISCHGGHFIYKSILNALYKLNIHPAKPGEFSYRAFLNKKLDLLQ